MSVALTKIIPSLLFLLWVVSCSDSNVTFEQKTTHRTLSDDQAIELVESSLKSGSDLVVAISRIENESRFDFRWEYFWNSLAKNADDLTIRQADLMNSIFDLKDHACVDKNTFLAYLNLVIQVPKENETTATLNRALPSCSFKINFAEFELMGKRLNQKHSTYSAKDVHYSLSLQKLARFYLLESISGGLRAGEMSKSLSNINTDNWSKIGEELVKVQKLEMLFALVDLHDSHNGKSNELLSIWVQTLVDHPENLKRAQKTLGNIPLLKIIKLALRDYRADNIEKSFSFLSELIVSINWDEDNASLLPIYIANIRKKLLPGNLIIQIENSPKLVTRLLDWDEDLGKRISSDINYNDSKLITGPEMALLAIKSGVSPKEIPKDAYESDELSNKLDDPIQAIARSRVKILTATNEQSRHEEAKKLCKTFEKFGLLYTLTPSELIQKFESKLDAGCYMVSKTTLSTINYQSDNPVKLSKNSVIMAVDRNINIEASEFTGGIFDLSSEQEHAPMPPLFAGDLDSRNAIVVPLIMGYKTQKNEITYFPTYAMVRPQAERIVEYRELKQGFHGGTLSIKVRERDQSEIPVFISTGGRGQNAANTIPEGKADKSGFNLGALINWEPSFADSNIQSTFLLGPSFEELKKVRDNAFRVEGKLVVYVVDRNYLLRNKMISKEEAKKYDKACENVGDIHVCTQDYLSTIADKMIEEKLKDRQVDPTTNPDFLNAQLFAPKLKILPEVSPLKTGLIGENGIMKLQGFK